MLISGCGDQEFLPEELDEAILVNFRQSVKLLKSLGATVVPVSLPATPHALSTYYVLSSSEASSNLARYSGMFYGASPPLILRHTHHVRSFTH